MNGLWLAALLSTAALAAPPSVGRRVPLGETLSSGTYAIRVGGMVCRVCAKAITEEVSAISGLQNVRVDFDLEDLTVTVKLDKKVRVSAIRRALKRAARRVDLDVEFAAEDIRYRIEPL